MIDFEIIWKSIHNLASEEEKVILDKWIKSNPKHKKYYLKQKESYLKEKSHPSFGSDIEKTWKTLNSQVTKKNRVRLGWISSIAAASIAIVFILFYYNNLSFHKSDITNLGNGSLSVIKPGSNKAVLILDDGTEYNLSDNTSLKLNEDGTTIMKVDTEIKYLSEHTNDKKRKRLKYNILKVPRGGEFFIILSDNSKIWLNSETILKYPVKFSSEERIVTLEGEAYFEVSHSDKPFKVITGEQVVEVLGTSFNISSYKDDPVVYTTLVEGKVKVFLKDSPKIEKILSPNQQSYLERDAQSLSVRDVDPFPYFAWKEGRFYFKQKPLSEIMHTLSRWYDVEIKIENEKIGNLMFTGDIKRYENLDNILTLIKETNEMTYEFTEDRTVIIR